MLESFLIIDYFGLGYNYFELVSSFLLGEKGFEFCFTALVNLLTFQDELG